jgi:arylsulfatase A
MHRFSTLPLVLSFALLLAAPAALPAAPARPPNVVIFYIDDMGYADIGPFGAKGYSTPNLDRMAREGIRFTNFHVSSAVCSASRAALMTGCYHGRVGIHGALGPKSSIGINDNEMTIAELVKQKNYATAIFGKWHLGHHPQFLPVRHGFDEYYGLPYSNDMWPHHPEAKPGTYPPLPMVEGDKVVDDEVTPEEQPNLTTWYTERAVSFIQRNKAKPFFLYLPHNMCHVPLYVSDKFKGRTARGLFGDVIAEIDWSVGEVLKAIRESGIDEHTLVMFTSDNGPWLSYGDHAGSAGPLREGKGTSWEGGVRVPFVARWPGKIPQNRLCREPAMTIDILPTVAALTGAKLPDHKIDGKDIWPLLSGDANAKSPQEAYYIYYANNQLQTVISGQWKLLFPHTWRSLDGRPGGTNGIPAKYENRKLEQLELYDLHADVGETTNLADKHPDVVARLEALAEKMRADLGDSSRQRKGEGAREPGRLAGIEAKAP